MHQSVALTLDRTEGSIAYDVDGSGPLIVCVPGMGDSRLSYRYLAPALAKAGYRVVTMDLRGHGDSDATFTRYGDEATAEDVIALLEELGSPATIIGNSMGAAVGVLVAASRPELVSGLVLIGPFVRTPASANPAVTLMFRILLAAPWAAASWNAYLPTLYKGARPVDFAEYRSMIVSAIRRPGYAKAFSLTTRESHAASGDALAKVKTAALVVMGELDPDFANPDTEASWIADQLHGEVVMVADSGHYPQSQRPDVVNGAIERFLEKVGHRA
jgi:pimeloyl-ACP methyl ester carboxylesterase